MSTVILLNYYEFTFEWLNTRKNSESLSELAHQQIKNNLFIRILY